MLKKLNRITYPSARRPVKMLQFGEGNFLRAFADWMVDIINEKTDFNGSIQIVQPLQKGTGDLLNQQDGLYHVVLKGINQGDVKSEIRLITSVSGAINPYKDFKSFLKQAENPELRFVISNTTEAGIHFNQADSSPFEISETFPGKLTSLLFHRFNFFNAQPEYGLIIMPCELIERNGEKLKDTVLQYADHWKLPLEFTSWVNNHVTFCNTLVDRIVPGYPKDIISEVEEYTGFEDKLTVLGEFFHLWVIEADEGISNLFPADKAGLNVKFVKDLKPYRTRKVRILNGAHTAMVPVAYLRGLRTVQEAIEDNFTGRFISDTIFSEIIPTIDLPSDETSEFAHEVLERFKNPFIRHELLSISLNSISKFKVRVLPTILDFYKINNALPPRLTFSLASLIRFYKGDWNNTPIPLNDTPDVLEFAREAWNLNNLATVVEKFLSNIQFWDIDLTTIPGLTEKITNDLLQLEKSEFITQ